VGRDANPTVAIIESQSVKGTEKGGARIDPMPAMTQARRSRARSTIYWSRRGAADVRSVERCGRRLWAWARIEAKRDACELNPLSPSDEHEREVGDAVPTCPMRLKLLVTRGALLPNSPSTLGAPSRTPAAPIEESSEPSVIHRSDEESSEKGGESSERRDGKSTSRVNYPEESSEEANSRIQIAS
jgi:hypothetical protein